FESETFELNEADIIFDDNFKSDSEFDEFESKNEESLDKNDEGDITIEQNNLNNLISYVLIDKIQKCNNIKSFQTLWQLVRV
ncbi:13377_t:CDS:1, partial [Funneliformis mosseae]